MVEIVFSCVAGCLVWHSARNDLLDCDELKPFGTPASTCLKHTLTHLCYILFTFCPSCLFYFLIHSSTDTAGCHRVGPQMVTVPNAAFKQFQDVRIVCQLCKSILNDSFKMQNCMSVTQVNSE